MAGTVTASIVKNDSTSPPAFQNVNGTEIGQLSRAWVNFNGSTATIRASFNVSSVTRNSAGSYSVNLTTALADANYACLVTASTAATTVIGIQDPANASTASVIRVTTFASVNGGASDGVLCSVSVFR